MNKRIYISGAITGTTDFEERFANAEKKLREMGYEPVNPAKVNAQMPKDMSWDEYMDMSMCMLSLCDSIYMLKGWKGSKGAAREFEKAKELGLNIYLQETEWKERMLSVFMTR